MGRIKNWTGTRRGLIRLSWSKQNLYNLSKRTKLTDMNDSTLYQQMWQAKKEVRGYHDAEITEKNWRKIFSHSKNLVTANSHMTELMDAGFNPAVKVKPSGRRPHPRASPLMFAELERRLDFIVFRSHFASSILSAKQMILHGKVTVNGEKVTVSSTCVRDGDIIQVDPHMVCTLSGPTGTNMTFRPKPFSQPFLFLPPYLEVDYTTCSVVFLRSPTSQPGKLEIPSPFPPEVHALAYEYYIGRK